MIKFLKNQIYLRINFILKKIILNLIKIYQKLISPILGKNCRFIPTCSNYGIEAINRYGSIKGSILTIKRILRCNPLSKGGYDPVEELKK